MDKLIGFFKNKWTKLGFSLISAGYVAFLGWVAWLVSSYYFVPKNAKAIFALYIFINVIFGLVMIYTRKQVLTQISALFLHPIILVTMLFAFENWHILIPSFAVATIVFFASGASETLKTILGTIYITFFVIGYIGYLVLEMLSISVFLPVELEHRGAEYLLSPDGGYRLVTYVDDEEKENRTVSYYVEKTEDDIEFSLIKFEKFRGGIVTLTARYERNPEIRWLDNDKLYIDGKVKEIRFDGTMDNDDEEDDFWGETAIITTAADVTKAITSTPAPVVED